MPRPSWIAVLAAAWVAITVLVEPLAINAALAADSGDNELITAVQPRDDVGDSTNDPVLVEASTTRQVPPAPTQTFTPGVQGLSTNELPNPDRGEYIWYGHAPDPQGWPAQDSYTRYSWKQLEPTQGAYDFSAIDAELANAAARGGRFAFRVMSVNSYDGGALVPDYVVTGSNGFWYPAEAGRPLTFLPDWNSDFYISRWTALMQALGARYATDPRLAYVDIGGYGNYGEWHVYPFASAYPGPNGQTPISTTSANRLVDATVNAFPQGPLVMLTPNESALAYALSRSPRIGTRVDCLGGSSSMFGATDHLAAVPGALDRWKTAPFITEWCGNAAPGSGVFNTGDSQVQQYHVSLLSSGNYSKPFSGYTQSEQDAFVHANKTAGYRLVLDRLDLPRTIVPGSAFTVTSEWENVNVAPAYRAWTTLIQLRDQASNATVWQATSSLEVRSILPTNGVPVAQVDTFTVPVGVPGGTYRVAIQIVDPTQVSVPMRLAIGGRNPDGSYTLGTVGVR